MLSRLGVLFLLLALGFAVNSACFSVNTQTTSSHRVVQIDLKACRSPNYARAVLCGKHQVLEDRGAQSGRKITLNIVILPASSPTPAPDPIFFLAGGPGQGAARIASAGEDELMRSLGRERDLVFIDQRGTGESNRLSCVSASDRASLQNYFRESFERDAIRSCRQTLEGESNLKSYTTPIAMSDVEEIRQRLGYEKINLFGVSYGTLSALEYIRRNPDHVRSAVLAGVATASAKLPLHFSRGAQLAMDKLLIDCAEDESCRLSFPRLRDDFAAVLSAFANGPVRFDLIFPGTKSKQPVTLSRSVFSERLRLMLYDHSSASLIPFLIHRAAQGDWSPFGQVVVRPASAPAYTLALGTYLTITCSESVPFIEAEEITEQTGNTFMGDYRTKRHQRACVEWPRGEIPTDYFLPVESALPILLLSGDLDPAAPLEFARAAARYLPNSRQIVLQNTAHNFTSPCAQTLAVEFISKGSADNLDTSCVAQTRRPPFATELPPRYQR